MPSYIGTPGALVPLHRVRASEVSPETQSSTKVTMGGAVKVQLGPRARRVWDIDMSAYLTPAESAGLLALVEGGVPPWSFAEPYAQVTNVLSPAQSILAPGTWVGAGFAQGGPVVAGGAYAPHSVSNPDGGSILFAYRQGERDRPVVVPGIPVSFSAMVRGSGELALTWRDWDGNVIGLHTMPYTHASMARVSIVNRTPPEGAVSVHLWATGAQQAALPCMSWTPDSPPWSIGRGCNRVIIEGLSEDMLFASPASPGMRRSALSFTVKEVG